MARGEAWVLLTAALSVPAASGLVVHTSAALGNDLGLLGRAPQAEEMGSCTCIPLQHKAAQLPRFIGLGGCPHALYGRQRFRRPQHHAARPQRDRCPQLAP